MCGGSGTAVSPGMVGLPASANQSMTARRRSRPCRAWRLSAAAISTASGDASRHRAPAAPASVPGVPRQQAGVPPPLQLGGRHAQVTRGQLADQLPVGRAWACSRHAPAVSDRTPRSISISLYMRVAYWTPGPARRGQGRPGGRTCRGGGELDHVDPVAGAAAESSGQPPHRSLSGDAPAISLCPVWPARS